jgi:hypothetical protein
MTNKMIIKDERTAFIGNISYKFGYNFITFALFLDVIYRALRFNEAPWDLLAIVIISGLVMTVYQYRQKILVRAWLKTVAITFMVTFIIAFAFAFFLKKL